MTTVACFAGMANAADQAGFLEAVAKRQATLASAANAVVCVRPSPDAEGGGSGVLIDPTGYGLSNYHVVAGALKEDDGKNRVLFGGLNDGRLYPLTVVGIDPSGDIVLFKLDGRDDFPYAVLGDSDELAVGQRVAAIGDPFGLSADFSPTITLGFITGLSRYQPGADGTGLLEYADCIQFSSSINPGNSGGPLFDMQGRVVGINGRASFKREDMPGRGRVNVGIGYAVSINQVKRFLPRLYAGELVWHGTLGATVRTVGDEVIVDAIKAGSAGAAAGLALGDRVVTVNGQSLRSSNDFLNAITILPAEWPVVMDIVPAGGGAGEVVQAELGARVIADIDPWVPDFRFVNAARMRYFEEPLLAAALRRDPQSSLKLTGSFVGDAASPEEFTVIFDAADVAAFARAPGEVIARRRPAVLADAPDVWESFVGALSPLVLAEPPAIAWRFEHDGAVDGLGSVAWTADADTGVTMRWRFDAAQRDLTAVTYQATDDTGRVLHWQCRSPTQSRDDTPMQWTLRITDAPDPGVPLQSLDNAPVDAQITISGLELLAEPTTKAEELR